MSETRPDLARYTLGVLTLVALIVASLWTLRPFLGATIWAAMLVVATWPALLWFQAKLWGRRSLAVTAMVLILLLLFVLPVTAAITTIAAHTDDAIRAVKSLTASGLPALPDWIAKIPYAGPKAVEMWNEVLASGVAGMQEKVTPYARDVGTWLVTQAGVVGALTLQCLLTVVVAAVMYAQGEAAAGKVRHFGHRLGGCGPQRNAQPARDRPHRQLGWTADQCQQQDVQRFQIQHQWLGPAHSCRRLNSRHQHEPADYPQREYELPQRDQLSRHHGPGRWAVASDQCGRVQHVEFVRSRSGKSLFSNRASEWQ